MNLLIVLMTVNSVAQKHSGSVRKNETTFTRYERDGNSALRCPAEQSRGGTAIAKKS